MKAANTLPCLLVGSALFISVIAFSQIARQVLSPDEIIKGYAEHDARVLNMLPPHSALPPLLDLSKPEQNTPGAGKQWEDRFTGSMGVRPIQDIGVHSAEDLTSISTTTTEYGGAPTPLPAHSCDLILIGVLDKATAHLAYNRRFVYSAYRVKVVEILKGKGRIPREAREHGIINIAQLGGSIRFPSGHQEFFWEANEGFVELKKQYLLFLWKPVRSSETYMTSEAYLVQNGRVFPVILRSNEAQYSNMSEDQFIGKVKKLIAANKDGE